MQKPCNNRNRLTDRSKDQPAPRIHTSEGSLKTDISSSDAQAQSLASALQNSSITFVGNVDKANNYSYQNISVNYSDSQAMKAEYLQKGDIYAVRLSDVWKRFFICYKNGSR